jgi:hypothetical protein
MKGLCFNGQMIDKDDTVHSKLIADGDVFEMIGSGGAKIEARHWWRA